MDNSQKIADGISVEAYAQIRTDIQQQPQYRTDQNTDCDYYDGMQTSHQLIERLTAAGIPVQDSNLIKPTINALLGMEARSRADYTVLSDDRDSEQVAEAMAARMKETERESRADRAMSDAFAAQVKAGLGWVEVGREFDPLLYPYRVREVHRREIFWDWQAKEPDLSDARYLRRDRWIDRKQVALMFPKHRELLENSWSGWRDQLTTDDGQTGMARAYETESSWGEDRSNFINLDMGMICLSELWYRNWKEGVVLRLPNGTSLRYRKNNPYHQMAVAQGLAQPEQALLTEMNAAIWFGPHKLSDRPTPLPHSFFPYIPFWGFRKDKNRVPYGLVRDMRGPQDQIIDLDILLYETLNSQRVVADNDAVDIEANSHEEVARKSQALRSYIILNANRVNKGSGFQIMRDSVLTSQVMGIIQERKQRIEEVAGIYRAMLGQDTNAQSGVAIAGLVEQGTTTSAELTDNFRYGRQLVGEHLLAFLKHDLHGRETKIKVAHRGRRNFVTLNEEVQTETGEAEIQNDISTAQIKLTLEDVPSTPTYRNRQFTMLAQMATAAPPEYQAVLYPAMLELSDVSQRFQIAEALRKVGNVPQAMTEEEEAAAEEQARAQQQETAAYQKKAAELELELKAAQIEKLKVETEAARREIQARDFEAESLAVRGQADQAVNASRDEASQVIQGAQARVAELEAAAGQLLEELAQQEQQQQPA